MQAGVVAGGLFGWTLVFAGLVAFFGLVWARRRQQVEYLLFAVYSLASAVHTAASGYFYLRAPGPEGLGAWRLSATLTTGSAVVTMPLLVHFGLRVAGLRWGALRGGAYALAVFYLAVLGGGRWWQQEPAAIEWVNLPLGLMPAARPQPGPVALSFYAAALGAVGLLCVLMGRGLAAGDRALRPSFMASIGLAAAGLNDVVLGTWGSLGLSMTPLGYLVFAFGVSLTLVTRYTSLSEDLERSADDLEKRTDELGRSYDALKQAQSELVKREQLAVIGELAAVIAHEVRNPLAVITNAVAGLKRSETRPEDRATLLDIINEESARMNRLVGDLLAYARPVTPQRQPTALGEFVERSARLVLASTPGVSARFECDPACPAIDIDPNLIRRVLDNLIGNAVQAMHEEGTLIVRLSASQRQGVAGVLIEIQDDGEGMDTQIRTQATTPFFTTRPSGTGLGLAIVDRIIEAHGGSMSLDSKPGAGTTVRLFFPDTPR